MKPPVVRVVVLYAVGLLIIAGTWLENELTRSDATFGTLAQQDALKALVIGLVGWLLVCALHYQQTGAPAPPPPTAIPPHWHDGDGTVRPPTPPA